MGASIGKPQYTPQDMSRLLDDIEHHTKQAFHALSLALLPEATAHLQQALDLSVMVDRGDDQTLATLCFRLAEACARAGDAAAAEAHYAKSLVYERQRWSNKRPDRPTAIAVASRTGLSPFVCKNTLDVSAAVANTAVCVWQRGDVARALSLFKQDMAFLEDELGPLLVCPSVSEVEVVDAVERYPSLDKAIALNNVGILFRLIGLDDNAALVSRTQGDGASHESYNDLRKRSVAIFAKWSLRAERGWIRSHAPLATLVRTVEAMGLYVLWPNIWALPPPGAARQFSLDVCSLSLVARRRLAGVTLEVAAIYNNMGEIHRLAFRLEKAIATYRLCLALREKLAPDSSCVAAVLCSMSVVFVLQSKLKEAARCAQRALDVAFRTYNEEETHKQQVAQQQAAEAANRARLGRNSLVSFKPDNGGGKAAAAPVPPPYVLHPWESPTTRSDVLATCYTQMGVVHRLHGRLRDAMDCFAEAHAMITAAATAAAAAPEQQQHASGGRDSATKGASRWAHIHNGTASSQQQQHHHQALTHGCLVASHVNLGVVHGLQGSLEAAKESFTVAIRLGENIFVPAVAHRPTPPPPPPPPPPAEPTPEPTVASIVQSDVANTTSGAPQSSSYKYLVAAGDGEQPMAAVVAPVADDAHPKDQPAPASSADIHPTEQPAAASGADTTPEQAKPDEAKPPDVQPPPTTVNSSPPPKPEAAAEPEVVEAPAEEPIPPVVWVPLAYDAPTASCDPDVATAWCNLGEVHRLLFEFDASAQCFLKGLSIFERLGEAAARHAAAHHSSIDDFIASSNAHGTADAATGDAPFTSERNQLGINTEAASCIHSLGMIARSQGRYDEALALFGQARAIRKNFANEILSQVVGRKVLNLVSIRERAAPDSLDVAASYNSMGEVYLLQHRFDQAMEHVLMSLLIRKKHAPDSLDVAESYSNLGELHRKDGRIDEAIRLHKQSLAIRRRIAPGSLDECTSCINLGGVYQSQAQYSQALDAYERATVIALRIAPESLILAACFANAGEALRLHGAVRPAMDEQIKAAALRERLAPLSLDMADSYSKVGLTHLDLRQPVDAADCFRAELDIREALVPGTVDVAAALHNLAEAVARLGRMQEAAALHTRSLALREQWNASLYDPAQTYQSMISVLTEQQDEEGALELAGKARALRERFGAVHWSTATGFRCATTGVFWAGDLEWYRSNRLRSVIDWTTMKRNWP